MEQKKSIVDVLQISKQLNVYYYVEATLILDQQ